MAERYRIKLNDEDPDFEKWKKLLKKSKNSWDVAMDRKAIIKNTKNEKLLSYAWENEPWGDAKYPIIQNENCPKEVLEDFLNRYLGNAGLTYLYSYVLSNKNCPIEFLEEVAKGDIWVGSQEKKFALNKLKEKGIKLKQERTKTNIDISDFEITDYYTDGQQAGIEVHVNFVLNGKEGDIQVIGRIDEDQIDLDDEMAGAYADETGESYLDVREELNNSHYDWSDIEEDIKLSLDFFLDENDSIKLSKKDYNYLINQFLKGIKSYINKELSYDEAIVDKVESSFDEDMNYIGEEDEEE